MMAHNTKETLELKLSRRTMLFGALGLNPFGPFGFRLPTVQTLAADAAALARVQESMAMVARDRLIPRTSGFDAAMEQDSKTAWQYFQIWKAVSKPMIPGTAYLNAGRIEGYPLLTMWDVGSLILAFASAFLLGHISQTDLNLKAQQVIKVLQSHTVEFGGTRLPSVEISASKVPSARSGFDAADVGRLLVALKILDHLTLGHFPIPALVGGWNFAAVTTDGNVCGVKENQLQTCSDNSYSHYAKRGYQLWGYDLKPVSGFSDGTLDDERKATIFKEVVRRGRIATEPNATEAIELGENDALGLAIDVLLAAQMKRYQKEKKLTCVSEGNLDQTPWFTYQSCQLDLVKDDQWVIETTDLDNLQVAKKKGDAIRSISSKGCFLWHAIRPGEYSTKLLECARQHARTRSLGFASNIYEAPMRPTKCSDINANAVILEALAFVKHGRQPLLQLAEAHRANAGATAGGRP
jgi:hypothetical protein